MLIDTNDPKNYTFEVSGDKVTIHGPLVGYCSDKLLIATKDEPKVYCDTNNTSDRILRAHLHRLKGAKRIKNETVPNWDEDPYGRRVQRGTINVQVWDLSGCFA